MASTVDTYIYSVFLFRCIFYSFLHHEANSLSLLEDMKVLCFRMCIGEKAGVDSHFAFKYVTTLYKNVTQNNVMTAENI